jgi:MFS family permease
MTAGAPRVRGRIFYGYWLVAFAFLCMLIHAGCGPFVFAMFVKPLGSSFGWGRGQVMAGFTIFYLMMGVASPFVGRAVDRYGVRPVIPVGALVMGVGFVIASRMSDLYVFYVACAFSGTGAAIMGHVPASAMISNWFARRRGTAVGVMAAGLGAGGVVMAPITAYIIENYGWRDAYFAMAVIIWVTIIPLALLLVRTRPSEMGLYPDGDSAPAIVVPEETSRVAASGLSLRQSMVMAAFWLMGISYGFSAFSAVGTLQTVVPFLGDKGYPLAIAAAAIGVIGVGSGVGKVFFGWLSDRVQPRFVFVIGLCLQLGGVLMLLNVHAGSPLPVIWTAALVLGLGNGSWLPTMSLLVSTRFGLASYGAVFGAITLLQSTGLAIGPLFAGMMYDATGTYYVALVVFAGLYAISIPSILFVRRPKSSGS